jgi:hypothetical protein
MSLRLFDVNATILTYTFFMKQLPQTENPLVLRTDFSNEPIWQAICAEIQKPVGIFRFRANVEFLDDVEYAGVTKEQLLRRVPKNYNHSFIVIVDQAAISHPDHPLLIVDLFERSGNEFRAVPSQIQGIENNLSIANMDFEEFAEAVDEDGIFRGFSIK